MAKYRPIKTSFWEDEYVLSLKTDEKLLFLFLLTNSLTTLCGIYRVSIGYIYRMSGIAEKRVLEILTKFNSDGRIKNCSGWVYVVNMRKHQSRSPHIATGIEREEAEIPHEIKETLYGMDRVSSRVDKPILKLKLKLKLTKSPNGDTTTAGASEEKKIYGNPEISNMLMALKKTIGVNAFIDRSIERNISKHCITLLNKIGTEEFTRRLNVILQDPFHKKNCNKIKYVYNQILAFIEPKPSIRGISL